MIAHDLPLLPIKTEIDCLFRSPASPHVSSHNLKSTNNMMLEEKKYCVEHGYLYQEEPEDLRMLSRYFFPSKIGGNPAWLVPERYPSENELCCRRCGSQMGFLLQIYASRSGESSKQCAPNPAAFHRMLYLFSCRKCPDQFRLFRSQLPRVNEYYMAENPHDLGSVASVMDLYRTSDVYRKGDKEPLGLAWLSEYEIDAEADSSSSEESSSDEEMDFASILQDRRDKELYKEYLRNTTSSVDAAASAKNMIVSRLQQTANGESLSFSPETRAISSTSAAATTVSATMASTDSWSGSGAAGGNKPAASGSCKSVAARNAARAAAIAGTAKKKPQVLVASSPSAPAGSDARLRAHVEGRNQQDAGLDTTSKTTSFSPSNTEQATTCEKDKTTAGKGTIGASGSAATCSVSTSTTTSRRGSTPNDPPPSPIPVKKVVSEAPPGYQLSSPEFCTSATTTSPGSAGSVTSTTSTPSSTPEDEGDSDPSSPAPAASPREAQVQGTSAPGDDEDMDASEMAFFEEWKKKYGRDRDRAFNTFQKEARRRPRCIIRVVMNDDDDDEGSTSVDSSSDDEDEENNAGGGDDDGTTTSHGPGSRESADHCSSPPASGSLDKKEQEQEQEQEQAQPFVQVQTEDVLDQAKNLEYYSKSQALTPSFTSPTTPAAPSSSSCKAFGSRENMILWYHENEKEKTRPGSVPPCSHCGGPRSFDFQLMPSLIFLSKSHHEFGTVLFYTCDNSCSGSSSSTPAYFEEHCFVQAEPAGDEAVLGGS
ncbi:unnamed protein product [Amoebophrya sp. A25]|nr:unnamed protein product [Amoebophrya sp. A25]|eukprot:GSA25T00018843001.1